MTIRTNIIWNEKPSDPIKTVELEKFVSRIRTEISMVAFDGAMDIEVLADSIVFKMQRHLLAEHPGPPSIDVTWPKTWWQHFKQYILERPWCPLWTRRLIRDKYPVKYITRKIDVKVIYPTIKPLIPEKQHILCLVDKGIFKQNGAAHVNSDTCQRNMSRMRNRRKPD